MTPFGNKYRLGSPKDRLVSQGGTMTISLIPGGSIAQPDVTLLLDLDGVIQGVTLSNEISNEAVEEWRGPPWFETVADMGGSKVLRMVEDARESGVSAYRQVNQRFP